MLGFCLVGFLFFSVNSYSSPREFYKAILIGDTETVKILIEAGADVNAKNNYGTTALMYAGLDGHTEIIDILIAAGARY